MSPKPLRRAALVAALLLTATPARADFGREDPDESWMPPNIDWSTAREIVVTLHDNLYEPQEIHLETGNPYKLVLRNVGARPHDMVDPDFFHSIVIRRVVTDGGSVLTPHIHSLYIQPGKESAIYFVPVVISRSSFFCTIPGHREDGMEGMVTLR